MARSLSAFISYRRADAFARAPDGAKSDFIDRLKEALAKAGFTEIFHDTDLKMGMRAGDVFEARIYDQITNCDLFIALIGTKWHDLLESHKSSRDILVREIRAALRQEKEIVPLLIDGATLDRKLPDDIAGISKRHAIDLRSDTSVEQMTEIFTRISEPLAQDKKLGLGWLFAYVCFSVLAYYFCAINPHLVGVREYGIEPWIGMATVWSGFYVWPVFFLPFSLLALYRPLTTVCEFATNAVRFKDKLTYATPLIVGTIVAFLAIILEVMGVYETPWTIYPTLPPTQCVHDAAADSSPFAALSSYDCAETLRPRDRPTPFWLKDKGWPNVFFYLTVPASRSAHDANYDRERPLVQQAFVNVLRKPSGVPYSKTFRAYVASFSILIWLAAIGVVLSIFYVVAKIRRPHDDLVLSLPTENAYLCLTYSLVTLMVWIPFRMNTVSTKRLYFCPDLEQCDPGPVLYFNDAVLGIMLLIGYAYLTVGLLVRYRRMALAVEGALTALVTAISATLVVLYSNQVAVLSEFWQFYLGLSILAITALTALWFQFNPAAVHRNDFDKDIN